MLSRITAAVEGMGLEEETTFQVNLVLEELSINAMTHGAVTAGVAPRMDITMRDQGSQLTIEVADAGRAFNPLEEAPQPPVNTPGQPAPTGGGLGIHLVPSILDSISYRHQGGMNRLLMTLTR